MKKWLLALALSGPLLAAPWPPRDYALCYGPWTPEMVQRAHRFELVVVHPGEGFENLTPGLVSQIQAGQDGQKGTADDVVVLSYVTIGEDDQPPAGPPPATPQPGPSYHDAKGWHRSNGGYPSRFLDEVAYVFEANGERRYGENGKPLTQAGHDGIPDENGVWGSYYVNPADPEWQAMILARMKRLQDEFGVDGFFLDTVDTSSPWGSYPYSQPEMAATLQKIRKAFPQRKIMANRGMFLLESHPKEYSSSIDGMLYESLYLIWDWGARKGVLSPWATGDYAYLKSPVLPAAQGKPGFHLFFVNYLKPDQSDYFVQMHAIEDLVGRKGVSNYVSEPELQQLPPSLSEVFPEQGAAPPTLSQVSVQENGPGRFQLRYELGDLEGRELGKDLFLDLRVGKEKKPLQEACLLEPVPVDSAQPGLVEGFGLQPGATYYFYLRVVGKTRSCRTPYQELVLPTQATTLPTLVEDLKAVSLESAVQLRWRDDRRPAYRIYQGTSPSQLQAVTTSQEPACRVSGLSNGQPVYFSVAGMDAQGREGPMCRPVLTRAEDCTPPGSPAEVVARATGNEVSLTWSAVPDAATYKVYCLRKGEKFRIPLRVAAPEVQASLGKLGRGKYECWVTAVDGAGNESRRNQRIDVEIR